MADDNSEDINLEEDNTSITSALEVEEPAPLPEPEAEPEPAALPEPEPPSRASLPPEPLEIDKSTISVGKSTISVGKSGTSVAKSGTTVAKSGTSVGYPATTEEESEEVEDLPPPPPERERFIPPPLGEATDETLQKHEYQAYILDKLYHEGTISRLGSRLGDIQGKKGAEGASAKYEDYRWQLDKMYRQVPPDMSVGKGRMKPDELLYEGEKFVLGKLYRDLREEDGYYPTAEKEESLLDLSDALEVNISAVEKHCPLPVYPSPSSETMKCIQVDREEEDRSCGRVNPQSGKVYEFTYSPVMAIKVDPGEADAECGGCPNEADDPCGQIPTTPYGSITLDNAFDSQPSSRSPSDNAPNICQSRTGNNNSVSGECRNNLPCQSNIEAVCKAARSAMAIYDTLTGCDNFPCNIGDRPEAEVENIEDTVWSWLYQIIFRLVPRDSNQNEILNTIQEEVPADNNDA